MSAPPSCCSCSSGFAPSSTAPAIIGRSTETRRWWYHCNVLFHGLLIIGIFCCYGGDAHRRPAWRGWISAG
eukprot:3880631-Pyramimonas_sp.AAC.1